MEEIIAQLLNIEDFGQFPNVSIMELKKLPKVAAIYFLYWPHDGGNFAGELSYIGRAKNVRSRWMQKGDHGILFCRQRVAWFEVAEDLQIEIEKRLIRAYQPPSNIQHCPRNHRRNWKK